jgi:hypothetical protein
MMLKLMLKLMLIFIPAWLPSALYGQATAPMWTLDDYRELNYPADQWYVGFVRDKLKAGDDVDESLKSLERNAQNQLAESIIVKIEGNTQVENTSLSIQNGDNTEEQITVDYRQALRTATAATAVKSEMKSYYEPSTETLYAFAAVRQADLVAFYQKQIDLDLNRVETALAISEQLAAAGKKISAFRKCEETAKLFVDVALYQDLLAAVNPGAGDEVIQTVRSNELQQTIAQTLINLEQSTFVYVNCLYEFKEDKDNAFDSDPGIICDIVKQALSENGCSVVDDEVEADYTLTLTAYTTQRSDGSGARGFLSYYANVKGTLYNRITQKKTANFTILNDPDAYAAGKTPETAATKAFKLPALKQKILDSILPKIKN